MSVLTPQSSKPLTLLLSIDLGHEPTVLACHQNGNWVAVGTDSGEVILLDALTNQEVKRWQAHKTRLAVLEWHPHLPLLASGGLDGFARIWAIKEDGSVSKLHDLKAHQDWVEHLAWRSDGQQLAVASGKDIRLFSEQGDLQGTYHFPHSPITGLKWRPQAPQLAVAGYSGILLFQVLNPLLKPRKFSFKGALISLVWSPDGHTLVAGTQDNSVHYWRLRDNTEGSLIGYEQKPKQLTWSHQSRWLAASGSSDVMVWAFDGNDPELHAPNLLVFHQKPITSVCFAPSGQWLATGGKEGKLAVWSKVAAEQPFYTLQGKAMITHLAWIASPSALKLVALTQNGILGIWQLIPKSAES